MDRYSGGSESGATALVGLANSKNTAFTIASYRLAHECTNSQRDGIENIDISSFGKKYCDDLMLFKFKEAEWCGIHSEPLYKKICGEL